MLPTTCVQIIPNFHYLLNLLEVYKTACCCMCCSTTPPLCVPMSLFCGVHILQPDVGDWTQTVLRLFNNDVSNIKGKSPIFNKAPHHEDVLGGVKVQLYAFLTSALDGDDRSASCPGYFIPM